MLRVLRHVEQHGEDLDAEVGVRLEPEAVGVLAVLDAQVGARELGAEALGDRVGHALVLEGLAEASQTGNFARFSASKYLRVALCSSRLPDTPPSSGGREGQVQDRVDGVRGQAVLQEPVLVGLVGRLRAVDGSREQPTMLSDEMGIGLSFFLEVARPEEPAPRNRAVRPLRRGKP